jgi:hypothetical protein
MGHGAWSTKHREIQPTASSWQRTEERGQEIEVRRKKKGILLWERLSSRDLMDLDNSMD